MKIPLKNCIIRSKTSPDESHPLIELSHPYRLVWRARNSIYIHRLFLDFLYKAPVICQYLTIYGTSEPYCLRDL